MIDDDLVASIEAVFTGKNTEDPVKQERDTQSPLKLIKLEDIAYEDLANLTSGLVRKTAPPDTGIKVETIARGDDEQFRIRFKEYLGHSYTSLEKWCRNAYGEWQPTNGTTSVRNHELVDVAIALLRIHQAFSRAKPEGE